MEQNLQKYVGNDTSDNDDFLNIGMGCINGDKPETDVRSKKKEPLTVIQFNQNVEKGINVELDRIDEQNEKANENFNYIMGLLSDSSKDFSFENYAEYSLEADLVYKSIKGDLIKKIDGIIAIQKYLYELIKVEANHLAKFDEKQYAMEVIYNNLSHDPKTTISCYFDKYSKDNPLNVNGWYHNLYYAYLVKKFNPVENQNEDELKNFLEDPNYKNYILNKDIQRLKPKKLRMTEAFVEFEGIYNLVESLRQIAGVVLNRYPWLDVKLKDVKKSLNEYTGGNAKKIFEFVDKVCQITIDMTVVASRMIRDCEEVLNVIEPGGKVRAETKARDRIIVKIPSQTKMIKPMCYNLEKINPWISTDYHLFQDLIRMKNSSCELTKRCIETHNKYVKKNDPFLFLGDLCNDNLDKTPEIREKLIETMKKMNGRWIMIRGNNDDEDKDFYLKTLGIEEYYEGPLRTEHFLFSHRPLKTDPGCLNVHGHIHGNHRYCRDDGGVNWKFDTYIWLWRRPIKLSEIVDHFNSGKYTAKSYPIDTSFNNWIQEGTKIIDVRGGTK